MKWLLLTSCMLAGASAFANTPPNIVLIVSDDQGYHDLGSYGNQEVHTPHLDRLAREGVRLTNFYVTWPACTPSRGSLLTGRYPQRNGVYDMIRNEAPDYGHRYTAAEYAVTFERIGGMDVRERLLPALLKPAGYTSGIYGKWDLGSLKRFLPRARGFDDFYGFVNTGIDYFTHERYGVPSMFRNDLATTEDRGTYCTDLFRREALRFLREEHDAPFFLYLPFNAPHSASNLDPQIRSAAQGPEPHKAHFPELKAAAGYQRKNYRYQENALVPNRAARRLEYLAAVSAMDEAIGSVLAFLDERGLNENTIVIFFSDNGGSGTADNGPLRGGKGQMFEGGLRVPCLVRFPAAIPAASTNHEFLCTLDLLPTLLDAAGVAPPADLVLDGHNVMDVLAGKAASPRQALFWQRRGDRAARVGNWKWVDSAKGKGLFDLASDLGEAQDLSQTHSEVLRRLQDAFANWRAEMDAAEPRGPFRDF